MTAASEMRQNSFGWPGAHSGPKLRVFWLGWGFLRISSFSPGQFRRRFYTWQQRRKCDKTRLGDQGPVGAKGTLKIRCPKVALKGVPKGFSGFLLFRWANFVVDFKHDCSVGNATKLVWVTRGPFWTKVEGFWLGWGFLRISSFSPGQFRRRF